MRKSLINGISSHASLFEEYLPYGSTIKKLLPMEQHYPETTSHIALSPLTQAQLERHKRSVAFLKAYARMG